MSSYLRLLVPSLLLAFAAPAQKDEIVFGVAAKTTLVRDVKSAYSMELDSMALTMDGEDVPATRGILDLTLRPYELRVLRAEPEAELTLGQAKGEPEVEACPL